MRFLSADASAAWRLSALDGSFLRLESSHAHMHVGWSAVFAVPDGDPRPTLATLHERVAGRLDKLGWCRWRLQRAPLGLSEPRWIEDRNFDLSSHVRALSEPDDPVSNERFADLRDGLLSEPLERSQPLWQMFLIPRLADGRVALLGKIHHALVDGIAALQIAGLVLDEPPDAGDQAAGPMPAASWSGPSLPAAQHAEPSLPAGAAGHVGWAVDELTHTAREGLRAIRATAIAAIHPHASVRSVVRDGRRVLRAAREDVLSTAPDCTLNSPIGARRTLVGYHASRFELRAARSHGGTLNDIGLTVVAGALRTLAVRRGETPSAPLKVMVPVSMRRVSEIGPGNQISMVYIQLPVDLDSPIARLQFVRAQTQRLKSSGRAEGTQTLYAASGLLPAPLRSPLVKALASPRVFNLTISQSPGPRDAVHMFGCEMQEVYSVVPIPERHSLAIGMVRYRRELFIGCYGDPDALPDIKLLPALLKAEMRALVEHVPPARRNPNPRLRSRPGTIAAAPAPS